MAAIGAEVKTLTEREQRLSQRGRQVTAAIERGMEEQRVRVATLQMVAQAAAELEAASETVRLRQAVAAIGAKVQTLTERDGFSCTEVALNCVALNYLRLCL